MGIAMIMDLNRKKSEYIVVNPKISDFTGNTINFDKPPLVSFCIPTLNNEETLENCLKSIVNQNYPQKEIIIIDGNSKDETINIAKKYANKIVYDSGTYGSACQTGVDHSTGQIIALFDSDIIIPHKEWLKNAIQNFNFDNKISSVWPLYIAPPNSPKVEYLYQTKLYWLLMKDRIQNNRSVFGGGNTLFLKRCLIEIGGINRSIHWGADFDWAMKLKDHGYKVVFIDDPLYHDTMRTLKQFYKKQFVGAKTFTQSGFGLMGLSKKDVFYENFILGMKGMVHGLIIERDISWFYYPVFLGIRILAYSVIFCKSVINRR
jgi:glycosyltransferase involved in cell wall biosynthesis